MKTVRLKNYREFAAVLIGMAVLSGSASVQAGEVFEQTKKFFEKTKQAIMGTKVHKLSLFSMIQNYQKDVRNPMRLVLVTLKISGNDALVYFCLNEPRFREVLLLAVTAYDRVARKGDILNEEEVGRRMRARFGRYMEKNWLVKVDAKFLSAVSDAEPAVRKTQVKCKAALS